PRDAQGVLRLQRGHLHREQLPIHAQGRGRAHLEVHVGGAVLHGRGEELVERGLFHGKFSYRRGGGQAPRKVSAPASRWSCASDPTACGRTSGTPSPPACRPKRAASRTGLSASSAGGMG